MIPLVSFFYTSGSQKRCQHPHSTNYSYNRSTDALLRPSSRVRRAKPVPATQSSVLPKGRRLCRTTGEQHRNHQRHEHHEFPVDQPARLALLVDKQVRGERHQQPHVLLPASGSARGSIGKPETGAYPDSDARVVGPRLPGRTTTHEPRNVVG